MGLIGQIRLPAEPLLGLLCGLFLFVLWGQKQLRPDLGLERPRGFWPCELRWWIGVYLLWMWIGAFFSPCRMVALKAAFAYSACVLPAFWAVYKMEKESPDGGFGRRVVWAALSGLGLMSLCALLRYGWHLFFGEPIRVDQIFLVTQPFLTDHTHWGAMLILWLFPCWYFVRHGEKRWQRGAALALLLVLVAALWVSRARASTASLMVPLCIVAWLSWRRYLRQSTLPPQFIKRCRCLVASAVIVAFVAGGVWVGREMAHPSSEPVGRSAHWGKNILSLVHFRQDASGMERVNRWKCALRLTSDYPIFGCGKDVYPFVYGPYQKAEDLTPLSTFKGDNGNAHSEYLSAFCETGLVGGLLFLSLVIFGFVAGVKAYRAYDRANDKRQRAWVLSLLLGLSAYFIQSLFNNFLYLDSGRFSVFLMWALLQAAYVKARSKKIA